MKRKISVLIVDDVDQSKTVKMLTAQLRSKCDLECLVINTTSLDLRKDGSDHLDPNKLCQKLKETIAHKSINWAFTDFNLAENEIDGLSVVEMLNALRQKLKIVMYSGDRGAVVKKVLGKSPKEAQEEEIIEGVRKLLEYSIIDYVKRDDYDEKLIELVNREVDPTVQDYFIEQLRLHSEMEFKSCYPRLKGKKLGEIADMIESHQDMRTDSWMKELVEQTIAYLVKINE